MCCFLNNQSYENNNPRLESLKIFIEYGANINEKNPITLWSPIHWVCHYGDIESLKFLLENNAYSFIQER
jgi:ankyrin repeat protein